MNLSPQKDYVFDRIDAEGKLWKTRVFIILCGIVVALIPLLTHAEFDSKPKDEAEKREQLFEIRSKQIPLLEQFIQKYPNSPRVGDTMFRLGEAYFETANHWPKSCLKVLRGVLGPLYITIYSFGTLGRSEGHMSDKRSTADSLQ